MTSEASEATGLRAAVVALLDAWEEEIDAAAVGDALAAYQARAEDIADRLHGAVERAERIEAAAREVDAACVFDAAGMLTVVRNPDALLALEALHAAMQDSPPDAPGSPERGTGGDDGE